MSIEIHSLDGLNGANDYKIGHGHDDIPRGMFDEAQYLGRTKIVCYVRAMDRLALDFFEIKQSLAPLVAESWANREPIKSKIATVLAHADKMRDKIRWVNDRLYWIIDMYLGGREGSESAIGAAACRGVSIPFVEEPQRSTTLEGPWLVPGIAIGVGGLAALFLYFRTQRDAENAVVDDILEFCKGPDVPNEKCKAVVDAADKLKASKGVFDDLLKPIGIAAGVGIVAIIGASIFSSLRARQRSTTDGLGGPIKDSFNASHLTILRAPGSSGSRFLVGRLVGKETHIQAFDSKVNAVRWAQKKSKEKRLMIRDFS